MEGAGLVGDPAVWVPLTPPPCSRLSPQSSAAFWGDPAERRSLQRVAAVAFPSTQDLEAWQQAQDAAALRDHRRIGRVSPGEGRVLGIGCRRPPR